MKATQVCSVPTCDALIGPHGARGFCSTHYERARASGEIQLLPALSLAERLAAGLERKPIRIASRLHVTTRTVVRHRHALRSAA